MNLYLDGIKALFKKLILRKNTGIVIKEFCEKHGIVYIKFAQILATQNYGNLFTENDRKHLQGICDNCNIVSFDVIIKTLKQEYGENLYEIFSYIDESPIGAASVSQVHRATLISGEEVILKIKRQDISSNINYEVKRLKKIITRYGKLFKFNNFGASSKALDLYLSWIKEEINFENEIKNIKNYSNYIQKLNKTKSDVKITTPKLYEHISTGNVIVMEYIDSKTINKMNLDDNNNLLITKCMNHFLKTSLNSILNDDDVILHGDPHSGNIYISENGNIGFLDMGLVFYLNKFEIAELKSFFLATYSKNHNKLFDMLSPYSNLTEKEKNNFYGEIKCFCNNAKYKDVTFFITDMINICLKYEITPPDFLFKVAKTFVCLNGINNFTNNNINTVELIHQQLTEYMIKNNIKNLKCFVKEIGNFDIATFCDNVKKNGTINALVAVMFDEKKINSFNNLTFSLIDDLNILKDYYSNYSEYQHKQENNKQKTY